MTWKHPIIAITYEELLCHDTRQSKLASAGADFCWEGTVLLKKNKKVVAVCEVKEIFRTGIIRCTYEEIEYGLKAIKIRRPKQLRQLMGCEIDPETMMIMTWDDCWTL